MKEYQQQAVELGFLHDRYLRGTAPADFAARGTHMVHRLAGAAALRALPPAPGLCRPTGGGPMTSTSMVTSLVRLREALRGRRAAPRAYRGPSSTGTMRGEMVDQLEDYVLPRLIQIDAPLLAVVGGSTGAGKSTLVNSLVGAPGHRARRAPADDALPGARAPPRRRRLVRPGPDPAAPGPHHRGGQRHRHPPAGRRRRPSRPGWRSSTRPTSTPSSRRNRTLAAELLAAADLWLFVTSAARYADQVPWDFLKAAAERSTAVAVVLDRTAAGRRRGGEPPTWPACSPRGACGTRRCSS